MEKPAVLQVNKLYYPFTGGIEQVVRQIAEGLKDCTEMQVLVCRERGHTKNEIVNGIRVCRSASIGMIGNLPIPISLLWQIKSLSKKADIIQFHMPFPFGDLAGLLSGYRGKVIIWWHSDVVRQKKLMLFYRPIMEQFLKRADKIIVATEGHINGSAYLKPYRKKCVIIPFGVDIKIEQRADAYWKQYITLPICTEKKELNFLFVGRLVYYKGCDILLSAFADFIRNSKFKHTLTVVGNGPIASELKKQVKDQGIINQVRFAGNLSEEKLYQQFEACDVFILPSVARSEAFGLVQIEAMAFGKPIINTNLQSGVPYVSLHQITGLTVEPGNITELRAAMEFMEQNPEKRIKMGKEARKRMKQEYQMQIMLKRIKNLYDEVLKE